MRGFRLCTFSFYYKYFSSAIFFRYLDLFPSIVISPSLIILLISLDKAGRDTFRYSASCDWVCMISTVRESFSYVRISKR